MKINITTALVVLSVFTLAQAFGDNAEKGEMLFKKKGCIACHSLGTEVTNKAGPSLANVTKTRELSWLKRWIKNPNSMHNDPEIKKLRATHPIPMPDSHLSDQEVNDIIAYLKTASEKSLKKNDK